MKGRAKPKCKKPHLSQLDEWKGKTRKESGKSGKVEKHALLSDKPT